MFNKMHFGKGRRILAMMLMAGLMAVPVSCGSSEEQTTEAGTAASAVDPDAAEQMKLEVFKEEHQVDEAAVTGEGYVNTFLSEDLPSDQVKDQATAEEVLSKVMERLGGKDGVNLSLESAYETSSGLTYYIFTQFSSDVKVYGTAVKVIVNDQGKTVAVASSIVPGIKEKKKGDWIVSDKDAEKVVEDKYAEDKLKVVKDATEAVLLPMEQGSDIFYYAWVVYTPTPSDRYDADYLAHYISMSGDYLYNMPSSIPGSDASRSGVVETFDFSKGKPTELKTKVKHKDGSEEEITVPTLTMEDGAVYLADAKRKILCADFTDFLGRQELRPTSMKDGQFKDIDVMDYYGIIQIYDQYKEMGWEGADGKGTPILLLMDAVDEDGEPYGNASYRTKINGYQVFTFDGQIPFGDCLDVMGHEYTHCVTGTLMTMNLYVNDYGAINESLSDILGNLLEMSLGKPEEGYWIIGENLKNPVRSMADPHQFSQPEFVGDRYYVPGVTKGSDENDRGGVHTNSSLLSLISYRLHQAGMPAEDQMVFWINLAATITPRTDYPEIAKILPWCLEKVGYEKYLPALNKAIEESGIASHTVPDKIPEGCSRLTLDMSFSEYDENYDVILQVVPMSEKGEMDPVIGKLKGAYLSWPAMENGKIAVTVGADTYGIMLVFEPRTPAPNLKEQILLYTGEGWEVSDVDGFIQALKDNTPKYSVKIDAGQKIDLKTDELKKLVEGQ